MFHGEPFVLDTVRAPTRAMLKPDPLGFDKAYGFQEGQVVPTGAFPAGEYTLEAIVEHEGSVQLETFTPFVIDPSNSSTCAE